MRVKFCIGVRMVNAVHNAIGSRAKVWRTLRKPGKEKEETLPAFIHVKCLVSGVSVLKKGLGKKGQVPVQYKKKDNKNHGWKIKLTINIHLQILRHP